MRSTDLQATISYPLVFYLKAAAADENSTLSLHDALPISRRRDDLACAVRANRGRELRGGADRKSTRLNSSHMSISYAVFCLKKKKNQSVLIILSLAGTLGGQ